MIRVTNIRTLLTNRDLWPSLTLWPCSLQWGGGQHVDHWPQLADGRHSASPGAAADRQVSAPPLLSLTDITSGGHIWQISVNLPPENGLSLSLCLSRLMQQLSRCAKGDAVSIWMSIFWGGTVKKWFTVVSSLDSSSHPASLWLLALHSSSLVHL